MPSLKSIRKRIVSVKATQKITRAMKMVAGARLARAQARITALRPYAVKTQQVLASIAAPPANDGADGVEVVDTTTPAQHPLLVVRPEKTVLFLVLTSDRGLCGAFNSNLSKATERAWRERTANGQEVRIYTVGRKGRDYLRRRGAPVVHDFQDVWTKLDVEKARLIATTVIAPLLKGEVDAIYLVYNEFKSAMTQKVTFESLLPLARVEGTPAASSESGETPTDDIFEPSTDALLDRLVPMYVETAILRALYESMASELGARMTAMDAATKNAKEMIGSLTLVYNRARQAAITKELMEIIGGAEALKE
jgi:F-type H+-transporting ATPase subunit gamma